MVTTLASYFKKHSDNNQHISNISSRPMVHDVETRSVQRRGVASTLIQCFFFKFVCMLCKITCPLLRPNIYYLFKNYLNVLNHLFVHYMKLSQFYTGFIC